MNDKIQGTEAPVSARRRLIRGVFAAPAALTLYSGSVSARSVINCVTKRVTSPELPGLTTEQGTTFIRVQLQKFSGVFNSTALTNRTSRWIKGSDIALLQAAGRSVYMTATQWQLYDRGNTNATSRCDFNSSGGNIPFNPASAYSPSYPATTKNPGDVISSTPTEAGTVSCGSGGGPNVVSSTGPVGDQWVAIKVNSAGDIVGVVGINNTSGQSAIWQSCWTSFRIG